MFGYNLFQDPPQRMNPADLSTSLLTFNLGQAVPDSNQEHNLAVEPADVVTVVWKEDIQGPLAKQIKYVRLHGEVAVAGFYHEQPGENLRKAVQRSERFTAKAYLYGSEFTRECTRSQQQKQLKDAISRLKEEAQRGAMSRSQAVVSADEAEAPTAQAAATNALLDSRC
jgi:hypothetical protein